MKISRGAVNKGTEITIEVVHISISLNSFEIGQQKHAIISLNPNLRKYFRTSSTVELKEEIPCHLPPHQMWNSEKPT